MNTVNIFGSTGMIGSKTLEILKKFFPKIKINILVAKKNYKKLSKQALLYNPRYICLIDNTNYNDLKNLINNKTEIIHSNDLKNLLKETKTNLTILSIAGYESLNFIESILQNTNNLGIVNKEAIIAAGNLINKLSKKYKTNIYALDSEHFSIQNFFNDFSKTSKKNIKKIFLTASGGPFYNKSFSDIKNVSFNKAIKHPKWNMGIKNSVDSASLVNKCLEIIEAHYLFNIDYKKLDIIIHPESLVHSIIEFDDYTTNLNYFYHDMLIPIYNFFKNNAFSNYNKPKEKNYDFKENLLLNFSQPKLNNYPILKIFNKMNKLEHKNIIKFNSANEYAVKLYSEKKIQFGDIHKIIENSLCLDINMKINNIKTIINYQNELINQIKLKIINK